VREDEVDGGLVAIALGHAIATQGDTFEELRKMVRDAVRCHFGDEVPGPMPNIIRLYFVRDESMAVWNTLRYQQVLTHPRPAGAQLRVSAAGRLPHPYDNHSGWNTSCNNTKSSPTENWHSARWRFETRGRTPQAHRRGIAQKTGIVKPTMTTGNIEIPNSI
jgi:hypothetical protein